jgi:hypothetical protein
MAKNIRTQTVAVEDFTEHAEVKKCLEQLRSAFDTSNGGREFIVSDVLDSEGHQYVTWCKKEAAF